ncbi:hypothetical protein VPH35_025018 [Triticum aestivum]
MDKHTIRIYALGTTVSPSPMLHTYCTIRIIGEEDVDEENINLPCGLCVNNRPCKDGWVCLCCLLNRECYPSMIAYKKDYLKPSPTDMVPMTMTHSHLPAPSPASSLGSI